MSHHFDTPSGREDPRLNLCDFYLFAGRPGSTVMAMTVNPEADPATAPVFRDEGRYAFRFDGTGDGREDVSFEVRFGATTHDDGGRHVQSYEVLRGEGASAGPDVDGDPLTGGSTGTVTQAYGVSVFAGVVRDVFAGNAEGLGAFAAALAAGEYRPESFDNRENFFASRHVGAIVLEVSNELIGVGEVHGWATVSLHGHAPQQQVARWGLPLITHLFLGDGETSEQYNRATPAGDDKPFLDQIAAAVTGTSALAGRTADPARYAERVVDRLGRLTLPYTLGSPASFDFVGFNGRALHDDVMDVMLSLMTNSPFSDGADVDRSAIADAFPYLTPIPAHG